MMKVGITGLTGFFGQHLRWCLHSMREDFEIIEITRPFFNERVSELPGIMRRCDALIHCAGAHPGNTKDIETIYPTNMALATTLTRACEEAGVAPYILFASSTQRTRANPYGASKRDAGAHFLSWAASHHGAAANLVIPNEFGEGGKPFRSSVVSTFAHQIVRGDTSEVNENGVLTLVYAQDVAHMMTGLLRSRETGDIIVPGSDMRVGDVYALLRSMHESYVGNVIPSLPSVLDVRLFNTLRFHLYEAGFYPRTLDVRSDERGSLFEVVREKTGGQTFVSTTKPGTVRGNHYHARKIERFCVVEGEATIRLRKLLSEEIQEYRVSGSAPAVIDMPTFVVHNITNTGTTDLITLFWTHEIFDPQDPDTFQENV